MAMNKHKRIAKRNTKKAYDYIVGGYENAYYDGNKEIIPTIEELKEEIYNSAMTDEYTCGCVRYGRAPREMRFATGEFVKGYINWLVDKDIEWLKTITK